MWGWLVLVRTLCEVVKQRAEALAVGVHVAEQRQHREVQQAQTTAPLLLLPPVAEPVAPATVRAREARRVRPRLSSHVTCTTRRVRRRWS